MSEKLFRFLLSEIRTVRLVCQNPECGGVAEVPITRMGNTPAVNECRICSRHYFSGQLEHNNPIMKLAAAIRELQDKTTDVKIGFSLPDSTPPVGDRS